MIERGFIKPIVASASRWSVRRCSARHSTSAARRQDLCLDVRADEGAR